MLTGHAALGQPNRIAALERNCVYIKDTLAAALVGDTVAHGRESRVGVVVSLEGDAPRRAAVQAHHINLRPARSVGSERKLLSIGRNRRAYIDQTPLGQGADQLPSMIEQ